MPDLNDWNDLLAFKPPPRVQGPAKDLRNTRSDRIERGSFVAKS